MFMILAILGIHSLKPQRSRYRRELFPYIPVPNRAHTMFRVVFHAQAAVFGSPSPYTSTYSTVQHNAFAPTQLTCQSYIKVAHYLLFAVYYRHKSLYKDPEVEWFVNGPTAGGSRVET